MNSKVVTISTHREKDLPNKSLEDELLPAFVPHYSKSRLNFALLILDLLLSAIDQSST